MTHRRVGHPTGHAPAQESSAETDMNAAQREAQAFTLRAQGSDFDEIAQRCGYTHRSAAYKAYKRALARIPRRAIDEMRETIFAGQMQALRAMAPRILKGDTFAIREMTAIHDRMAKLFGLDTPVAVEAIQSAKVIVREYPAEWINALPPAPGGVPSLAEQLHDAHDGQEEPTA